MVRSVAVWVFACACWTVVVAQNQLELYEDDICKQTDSLLWTCKGMRDCPSFQEDFKTGKRPLICSFNGTEPIVCCRPAVTKPLVIGSKSKMMCKKYAEYAEKYEIFYLTNGNNAGAREFPHMALIGYVSSKERTEWLCGGSLISERFVLSAAHCTDVNKKGLAKWVRLGDYNIRSKADDEQGLARTVEYEIIERFNHPEYKAPSVYNDIALYKLNTNVEFNEYVRPICLQTDHQFPKTYAIATGWGRTEYGGIASAILQKVDLKLITRRKCADHYKPFIGRKLKKGIKDAAMFCAGDTLTGKDTCQGDSGGPLQVRLREPYRMYSQIGVTSFGVRCGGDIPGAYTRVSHYISWIESVVWP